MKSVIRDLLPYGVVTRIAAKKHAARAARRQLERVAMLRPFANDNAPQEPRLNMGCGTHHEPGWINADASLGTAVRLVLSDNENLPVNEGSLEVVFSEHFLEHLTLQEARWFLRESYRVLKPNGLFRVSSPDLEVVVRSLTDRATFQAMRRIYEALGDGDFLTPEEVVNWAFYGHEHRHLWAFEHLRAELTAAGFTDVRRMRFGESRVAGAAIEIREGEAFMSLTVEAIKP